ncbi:hypothetical protein [Paraburkholderia sediminicola]|uniref:hypothetical protein n=1 Tax=Paraburkholderia sediminicola TaxID=458836 RepID=UPI0038BA19E4
MSTAQQSSDADESDMSGRPRVGAHRETISVVQLMALTLAVIAVLYLWEGHIGYNLWDEGFLWYGVQRVLHGEVPLRDFMAYDPGRYYWSAALMVPFGGRGIVALRAATALFSWIGIFAGVWVIHRGAIKRDRALWLIATVTLAAWMYPWFKVFDNTVAILLVFSLAYLLRRPSVYRYFIAGTCVGLSVLFGRNHGVYGLVACCGALAYLTLGFRPRECNLIKFASGMAGVVVGTVPLLAMMLWVPGFAGAFWESVRYLLQSGATNFPLPVPYPWRVPFGQMQLFDAMSAVLLGSLFLWIVAFGLLGLFAVAWKRWRNETVSPEFVAAILVSLPYAHYAYSRADVVHMAMAISPCLIACFVVIGRVRAMARYPLAIVLCAVSLFVVGPIHPGWQCIKTEQCVATMVGRDNLELDPIAANDVALLERLAHDFAPNNQNFIVAPFWPGAYALLGRKSPMWANYALWPRSEAIQRQEIERIKAADPRFALILNVALDGREDLRFSKTNPLIDEYIRTHFQLLKGYGPDPVYEVYKR